MKRNYRIGAIALGLLVAGGLILPRLVNVDSFRPLLESELTSALGRQVKVGNLSLSMFSGSVSADDISIADDGAFSKEPFITAKSFKAGVEVMPLLFSKTLHITGITLEEPQITLLRNADGNWNFSNIGGAPTTPTAPKDGADAKSGGALSVDKITIDKGRLLVGTANSAQKPVVYDQVTLEVTNFSTTTQFPFSLSTGMPGGGEFSLKGKCGPLNAGNAGATPFDAAMKVSKLDLAASGFFAASSGIQGVAEFDGSVQSNGQQVKTSGTLKAEKWKLVAKGAPSTRAVAVKYALDHNIKSSAGTLIQGDLAIGKAIARLNGSYQMQGPSTTLNMKAVGDSMSLDELEAALPGLGVVMPSGSKLQGGVLSTTLSISGPTDKITISGPIRMSNAKVAGLDLASKLSAIPGLSGKQSGGKDTTIQNCSLTLHSAPDGLQASAIDLTIPSLGVVTGSGSISTSGALNFAMIAKLSDAVGPGALQKAGGGGQRNDIPFSIEGTTSDPKFVPNVKAIAGNAVKESMTGKVGGMMNFGRKKK